MQGLGSGSGKASKGALEGQDSTGGEGRLT